jgi:uncharacterized membrane protein (DUF2068 family)
VPSGEYHQRAAVLPLIAAFKLTKGLLLVVLGVATISLRHRDVSAILGTWVDQLHLDPGGRFVHGLLVHAADLHARRLVAIGAGMLVYAALLLTEGFGLLLRRRWAEYLTVVATGALVPLELYEIARHLTWTRLTMLVVNAVIVWYLLIRIRARSEA